MKKLNIFAAVLGFTLVASASSAHADIEIPVVDYSRAADPSIWAHTAPNQLPAELVHVAKIPNPEAANQGPFPGVFFQNRWIVVCWVSCDQPQVHPAQKGNDFDLGPQAQNPAVLAQTNVYFWVSQLFMKMESLGFHPQRRLTVIVNRNILDMETGTEQFNNAFFNDKNWTLNFLNAQNGRLSKVTGQTFLPSFFDPSVAIHEATHSVFQALVGKIINQEVMGLHEAFADYFALAILNTPHIGQVMMRGEPMRMAEQTLVYKPGSEAHDLGNVVMAALWKIRQAAPNKNAADKIALETVRILGNDLYANAGDVVPANLKAAQSIAGGAPAGALQQIWGATGLKPVHIQADMQVVTTNGASASSRAVTSSYAVAEVIQTIPEAIAKDWGEEPMSHLTIANLGMYPGPGRTPTVWCHFAVSNERMSVPVWFLYDMQNSGVIAGYLGSGPQAQPIDAHNPLGFYVLSKLTSHMDELTEMGSHFGMKAMALFNLDQMRDGNGQPLPFHNGPVQQSPGPKMQLNGQPVQVTSLTRTVEQHAPINVHKLFGLFGAMAAHGPEVELSVTGVKSVTLHTILNSVVRDPRLPSLNGVTVIGYTITHDSGSQDTVLLTDIKK